VRSECAQQAFCFSNLDNTIIADHDAIPLSCGQRGKPDRERMTCGLLAAQVSPSACILQFSGARRTFPDRAKLSRIVRQVTSGKNGEASVMAFCGGISRWVTAEPETISRCRGPNSRRIGAKSLKQLLGYCIREYLVGCETGGAENADNSK
jgi:hypothetical protein